MAYDITGESDKAIADFNAAIQINANYGEAYINRGLAWVKKRDYDRGLADFTAATRDEKFAFLAFNNRANIYADNARSTRRAASLRERAMAANVPISSSVIPNSTACRHP